MTDEAQREMPRYQSHKKVWALEIWYVDERKPLRVLHFKDKGFAPIEAENALFARYMPVPGDFYVAYEDGYKSFSPRQTFLDGYTKI